MVTPAGRPASGTPPGRLCGRERFEPRYVSAGGSRCPPVHPAIDRQ